MWPRKKKIKEQYRPQDARYKLVDFSPVKDFIDYGLNKTLINLKLRRLTDIQVRETLMKRGTTEKDWAKIMVLIMMAVLIGVIAFSLITQVMSYNEAANEVMTCKSLLGSCQGQLAQYGVASGTGALPA